MRFAHELVQGECRPAADRLQTSAGRPQGIQKAGCPLLVLSEPGQLVLYAQFIKFEFLDIGVFGAGLRLFGWYREDLIKLPFYDYDPVSQIVSSVGFFLLCVYLWRGAMKKETLA